MRLLVTGASSFVGAWFCLRAARDHEVLGLWHRTPLALGGVRGVQQDLAAHGAAEALRRLEPDAVVHLAAKVMGSGSARRPGPALALNRQMMDLVLALGRPVVYGSSTCVHWPVDSGYARSRREDEARLAASGLPWVALRPCAPYGPPLPGHVPRHAESFHTLARLATRAPVVPVIGRGRARRQPVHVEDFADAALALLARGLPNQALDAGGAEALSFVEIIRQLGHAVGRRPRILPVPRRLMVAAARLSPDMEPALIAAADTDDLADPTELTEKSGLRMRGFTEGLGCLL
ncbi:MAG: NAD(P)-dependent oxidoreductase [Alphaproteobacteria bacterium]|nr:NAD(P)-dependent oxidoreductase [Alphaproteobacteria bacterium]MCB9793415.1 NAD(P)-dependent oxidoreductase [Alphaproteobacteria bacterium]